jgi:hypothetical protein
MGRAGLPQARLVQIAEGRDLDAGVLGVRGRVLLADAEADDAGLQCANSSRNSFAQTK